MASPIFLRDDEDGFLAIEACRPTIREFRSRVDADEREERCLQIEESSGSRNDEHVEQEDARADIDRPIFLQDGAEHIDAARIRTEAEDDPIANARDDPAENGVEHRVLHGMQR